MNKLLQIIKLSCVLVIIAMLLSSPKTYAKNITLNNVEFSTYSNMPQIMLNTDKNISINKKIISNNKILIDLKNTKLANNAKTTYTNGNSIEHILIKPKSNNLQIEVSGNNIANSKIFINQKPAIESTSNIFLKTLLTICSLVFVGIFMRSKYLRRKKISVTIKKSQKDMQSKILKVAFERRQGLIAQGTGLQDKIKVKTISHYNVRKVDFNDEFSKELKVKV